MTRPDAPCPPETYRRRIEAAQAALRARDLAACLVTVPENIVYLCGFDSPGYDRCRALLLPADGVPVLVRPAWDGAPPAPAVAVDAPYRIDDRPWDAIARAIGERLPTGRIAVGLETRGFFLSVETAARLAERLRHVAWTDCSGLVEAQRLVKDERERRRIRRAAAAARRGMREALARAAVGRSENAIAAAVFRGMLTAGSGYPASPPYVTCGERTALPHATWEGARLRSGDVLLIEHAASVDRYHAAIMRTACAGAPSPAIRHAHETVVRALEAALAAVRPGATGAEVDLACREVLRRGGWERSHATGYSIGLAYPPGWNEAHVFALSRAEAAPLRAGMALYLMPSVLVHGRATVGCGDTVLVTPEGCETLTGHPRRLFRLGR